ncbi:aminoglycoside phosphotransferase [Lapillicoccus jejuensis]|nr:aminoglycoside phosphotransferase [Lapillicoccus jejuensis]
MLVAPDDLSAETVLETVRAHWDDAAHACAHVPKGAGAHHWAVSGKHRPRWFVTADDLDTPTREDELRATYDSARTLVEDGLPSALATVPTAGGETGVLVGARLLTVTPYLEGESGPGEFADDDQRALVARAVGALHAAEAPPTLLDWVPGPPQRDDLLDLLGRLDEPWESGPYGDLVREALRAEAPLLRDLLARFDTLAAAAVARRGTWVPTHGEPHTANVRWTAAGPLLLDWESLRRAPRERDLRVVLWGADGAEPLSAYCAVTGLDPDAIDGDLVELFELEWWLWETASYAVRFHAEHEGDADDARFARSFLDEVVPAVRAV